MATVTSTDHILTPEAKEIHPLHCEMGEWKNGNEKWDKSLGMEIRENME